MRGLDGGEKPYVAGAELPIARGDGSSDSEAGEGSRAGDAASMPDDAAAAVGELGAASGDPVLDGGALLRHDEEGPLGERDAIAADIGGDDTEPPPP